MRGRGACGGGEDSAGCGGDPSPRQQQMGDDENPDGEAEPLVDDQSGEVDRLEEAGAKE